MDQRTTDAYAKRNSIVRQLGYQDYGEYLRSHRWRKIRKKVFAKSAVCVGCYGEASQVHHAEYTWGNLSGRSLEGLLPVCGVCHDYCEFDKDGKKVSPEEATRRLHAITSAKKPPPKPRPVEIKIGKKAKWRMECARWNFESRVGRLKFKPEQLERRGSFSVYRA